MNHETTDKAKASDDVHEAARVIEAAANDSWDELIKLQNGDKVKLNVSRIIGRKDFSTAHPEYQKFVKSNEDTIFTAHICLRSRSKKSIPLMVGFDESNRWLFWIGDLIKVNG